MGVAGVLMSVIVKAFSASPLFAAMMKMMKFMVTLILMPIGTFFGALLRPILIMLLRKFIIPFYSSMMPTLMNLGTQVGNAVVEFLNDPWKTLKNALFGGETEEEKVARLAAEEEARAAAVAADVEYTTESSLYVSKNDLDQGWVKFTKDMKDWWETIVSGEEQTKTSPIRNIFAPDAMADDEGFIGAPTPEQYYGSTVDPNLFHPKDADGGSGEYDPFAEEKQKLGDSSKVDPNDITGVMGSIDYAMNKEQLDAQAVIEREWEQKQLQAADQLRIDAELAAIKEAESEAEKQWHIENAAKMAAEREAKAEAEAKKQAAIDQKAAADAKAAAVDKRLKEALAKMEMERIEEIREAQMIRNAQQEQIDTVNKRFAGTPSEGKLSSSKNAGADVVSAMQKNASKGHVKLSQSNMNLSQATRDLLASMNSGVIPAAEGFDGMVNKPTMFMAGEAGSEHVKVTPNGQGGGSTITVNIQNMNAGDDDLRKLKKTILEVIQQSANNRGRL
jgi:hypothetical protein